MNLYINNLRDSSKINISLVGGKAANLIELSKLNDIQVPEGFCITTEAFKKVFANNSEFNALLDQLSFLDFGDKEKNSSN